MDHHDVDRVLKCTLVFDLAELDSWRRNNWIQDSNQVTRDEFFDNSDADRRTDWWTAAMRQSDKAYLLCSSKPDCQDDNRFAIVHASDNKVYPYLFRSALDVEFPPAFLPWFCVNPKPSKDDNSFMPIPGHMGVYEKKWP